MSSQRYPPEFKDEAVRQVLERAEFMYECSPTCSPSRN